MLKKLASGSGGDYFHAPSAADVSGLYDRIARQLANEYVLRYQAPRDVQDGTRRAVDVTVHLASGGDLSASGAYVTSGVLGAQVTGGMNWWFFGVALALLALLSFPWGLPAAIDGRRPRWRRNQKAAAVSPLPSAPGPVVAGVTVQRQPTRHQWFSRLACPTPCRTALRAARRAGHAAVLA